ncbi:AMP-binding protein [Streptomyces sp. GMY02]|uniref:AMP-binding protein n=1 Tax=Streptomyces sp. GMY02 TaxID=1333528 RepID=UPI001C2C3EED|nr:AMP-binding protein [Streptomyces sp. GMY02]QXE33843.1 AMP-binding protein [Streptomyces sp. GMY02]
MLTAAAASHGARTAIHGAAGDNGVTYTELKEASADFARRAQRAGVRPGDIVGLVSDNRLEFVLSLFGLSSLGAVVAPIDPRLDPEEVRTRLQAVGARAVLTTMPPEKDIWSVPALQVRAHRDSHGPALTLTTDPHSSPADRGQESLALPPGCELILFTAGSTGRPKAVPLTGTNLGSSVRGVISSLRLGPSDATLLAMPLFHGHGLMGGLLATFASGGRVALPSSGRFSAHSFWPEMTALGATWYTAVPSIHQILLLRASSEYPGPGEAPLRFIRSCSAPLSATTAQKLTSTFQAPVIRAYGMTETAHQTASAQWNNLANADERYVGVPTGVEIGISAPDGSSVPIGEEGEIVVRGASVMPGYLGDEPADTVFAGGRFRTGDLGRLDADGSLYLTGRIKEQINRGGEKISPESVESVLAQHPQVVEAVAFGIPDPLYGERVAAAVTLTDGSTATPDALREFCGKHGSAILVPDRIMIVPRMPLTAKGTADRPALARRATNDEGPAPR